MLRNQYLALASSTLWHWDYRPIFSGLIHYARERATFFVRFITLWGSYAVQHCLREARENATFQYTMAVERIRGFWVYSKGLDSFQWEPWLFKVLSTRWQWLPFYSLSWGSMPPVGVHLTVFATLSWVPLFNVLGVLAYHLTWHCRSIQIM